MVDIAASSSVSEEKKGGVEEQLLGEEQKEPKLLMVRTENVHNLPFEQTQEIKVSCCTQLHSITININFLNPIP